jgi:hypothetical protein
MKIVLYELAKDEIVSDVELKRPAPEIVQYNGDLYTFMFLDTGMSAHYRKVRQPTLVIPTVE